jgi:hypothetical protein
MMNFFHKLVWQMKSSEKNKFFVVTYMYLHIKTIPLGYLYNIIEYESILDTTMHPLSLLAECPCVATVIYNTSILR